VVALCKQIKSLKSRKQVRCGYNKTLWCPLPVTVEGFFIYECPVRIKRFWNKVAEWVRGASAKPLSLDGAGGSGYGLNYAERRADIAILFPLGAVESIGRFERTGWMPRRRCEMILCAFARHELGRMADRATDE